MKGVIAVVMTSPLSHLLFLVCAGCGGLVDPQIQAYRDSVLLKTEPTGAVTIEQAREHLEETNRIVLIGKVGNADIPNWWQEGRATLIVSEGFPGSDYNITPDHDPRTCPFCKWKWQVVDSFALIELVAKDASIIPVDAPTLLSVKAGDVVVVCGIGRLAEDGSLILAADGIFLR